MILLGAAFGPIFALSPPTSGLFWLGVVNGVNETIRISLSQ